MRADSHPALAHRRAVVRTVLGAVLLAVAGNALSLPGRRFVGRYDFGYAIRGDRPARLAQVFDDGDGKVYFEPRANQAVPAVFVGREPVLLALQPEGPYFTARTSEHEFTLVLGAARALVRRGADPLGDEAVLPKDEAPRQLASAEGGSVGGVDDGRPRAEVGPGGQPHEQPVLFARGSARLGPEVPEALAALALRIPSDSPITVVGRNDAGASDGLADRRSQALRAALLAVGVAPARLRVADDSALGDTPRLRASVLRWTSAAPLDDRAAAPRREGPFDIAADDADIAVPLRRWARRSGYEVVWDVDWRAPVTGATRVDAPTFLAAVGQVVAGLRAQGYPVQAVADDDRVLRFVAPERHAAASEGVFP